MVATSTLAWDLRRWAATAWLDSWMATANSSRSTYSKPSAGAHLLEGLGLPNVIPPDDVPVTPLGQDEGLIDQILDLGAGVVGRLGSQLVHLLVRDVMADLGQVTLESPQPALLGRESDLVDAVDAPRT